MNVVNQLNERQILSELTVIVCTVAKHSREGNKLTSHIIWCLLNGISRRQSRSIC